MPRRFDFLAGLSLHPYTKNPNPNHTKHVHQNGFIAKPREAARDVHPIPCTGRATSTMIKLAKLLHSCGFHVTFVLTHYNHAHLPRSRVPHALDGLPSFRFVSIPDGLPPSDADSTQSVPDLCHSLDRNCLGPFTDLLRSLNEALGPASAA